MSGPDPNNMNNKDLAPWTLIMVVGFILFAWFAGHKQISMVVLWVRYVEAHLLVFDPVGRDALARWLGETTAATASVSGLFQSGSVAGWSLRWFSLVFLLALFAWLIKRSPARTGRYAKKYTMKTLAEQEVAQWPVLSQVLGLNIEKIPLDDPINGMRMHGRAYARRHKLLYPKWTDPQTITLADGSPAEVDQLEDGRWIDISRTRASFASQLGRPWQGVQALRPHERALFAAFVAQMGADPKGKDKDLSLRIINELALASRHAFEKKDSKLLYTPLADEAIKKYGNTKAVNTLVRGHAHVRTVLMALLDIETLGARKYGVMPAAWFRWLKMTDRRTWYALNDLGLDVASAEAAGLRAQYQAERVAKTAIEAPQVDPAIKGLIGYLNTYLDDEEEES